MTPSLSLDRLDIKAFARRGEPLTVATPLRQFARLADEAQASQPDRLVEWQAGAELREGSGTEAEVWLHLLAKTIVPLTCQRCMQALSVPLEVDQWYRFVENEDIAMAEDDGSEEDLLVMETQFDLSSLVEDELLMGLPLVPMHAVCPEPLVGTSDPGGQQEKDEKPNPFAVLAQLRKSD